MLSLSLFNTIAHHLIYKAYYVLEQFKFDLGKLPHGARNFFPINAPGMGRFQLLNVGVLGYGLELRFWLVIAIIVCLTLTVTLITTLTII